MRVILFNPYYSFRGSTYVFHRASIPYNLLYIGNYLKQSKVSARIYELGIFNEKHNHKIKDGVRCGLSDEAILEILQRENPAIVGITTMYSIFHADVIELTSLIHKFNPLIRVVVGGNHASCFPERLLEEGVDQVVVGEGEKAFLSICQGNTDRIVRLPMVEDLDELPIPKMNVDFFNQYANVHNPFIMGTKATGIITSRGCPSNCIYCTVNGVWKNTWRGNSPKRVVDEIEYNIKHYGIDEFHFLDDNVSVDKKRWEGILDEILRRGVRIKWATPMAYWTIDERILDKMKEAGCYRLSFGIESGDIETRKFIGKTFPLKRATEIIKYANKIGLWTITTNIIGFPYETDDQIQNTIDYAKDCGTDFACFFNLIPHASSRVYPYFIKEGLIKEKDDIMSIMNEGGCDTLFFDKCELKALQKQAYKDFIIHKVFYYLSHPWTITRKIKSWQDFKYLARIFRLGLSMVLRSLSAKVSPTSKDFIYGKRQYV